MQFRQVSVKAYFKKMKRIRRGPYVKSRQNESEYDDIEDMSSCVDYDDNNIIHFGDLNDVDCVNLPSTSETRTRVKAGKSAHKKPRLISAEERAAEVNLELVTSKVNNLLL